MVDYILQINDHLFWLFSAAHSPPPSMIKDRVQLGSPLSAFCVEGVRVSSETVYLPLNYDKLSFCFVYYIKSTTKIIFVYVNKFRTFFEPGKTSASVYYLASHRPPRQKTTLLFLRFFERKSSQNK